MTRISTFLESEGYILRSGGARGADRFFENGIINPDNKRIYIIEQGFKGHQSPLYGVCDKALAIAKSVHPKWDSPKMLYNNCQGQRLHGRNVYQILGKTLDTPSKFVICWTPGGLLTGGTATAIKLAKKYNVPCLNLGSVTTGRYMDAFENFYLLAGAR
ncbi:hypothetical protein Xoosp13_265 [Xanthomonas phage Xoo-sp13]|nr:hypothetical protein Xoosp13_265 [Xanthomonas phage Xoo-sp13]